MTPLVALGLLYLLSRSSSAQAMPGWPSPAAPPPMAPPPPPPPPPRPPAPQRAPSPLATAPTLAPAAAAAHTPVARAISVRDAQRILAALGAKLKPDGLFGPMTRGAWLRAAGARGLPGAFDRLGPTEVRVSTETYEVLRSAAAARGVVVGMYIP